MSSTDITSMRNLQNLSKTIYTPKTPSPPSQASKDPRCRRSARFVPSEGVADCALIVFAVWAVAAPMALCLILEGVARDSLALGLAGTACVPPALPATSCQACIRQRLRPGELALALVGTALLALGLLAASLGAATSGADLVIFFALFLVVAGFFALYLTTRIGLRHTFSRFHDRRCGHRGRPPVSPALAWLFALGSAYLAVSLYWARRALTGQSPADFLTAPRSLPPIAAAMTLAVPAQPPGSPSAARPHRGGRSRPRAPGARRRGAAGYGAPHFKRLWMLSVRTGRSSLSGLLAEGFGSPVLAAATALVAVLAVLAFGGMQMAALSRLFAAAFGDSLDGGAAILTIAWFSSPRRSSAACAGSASSEPSRPPFPPRP